MFFFKYFVAIHATFILLIWKWCWTLSFFSRPQVADKQCPCGAGMCEVLTANTEKNNGRQFYKCPLRKVWNVLLFMFSFLVKFSMELSLSFPGVLLESRTNVLTLDLYRRKDSVGSLNGVMSLWVLLKELPEIESREMFNIRNCLALVVQDHVPCWQLKLRKIWDVNSSNVLLIRWLYVWFSKSLLHETWIYKLFSIICL